MIWRNESIGVNGDLYKLFMCQTEEEIEQVCEEMGIEKDINKFRYEDKGDCKIIIAHVRTICSNVFEQVYRMAHFVGYELHFDKLLSIIKSFDE